MSTSYALYLRDRMLIVLQSLSSFNNAASHSRSPCMVTGCNTGIWLWAGVCAVLDCGHKLTAGQEQQDADARL